MLEVPLLIISNLLEVSDKTEARKEMNLQLIPQEKVEQIESYLIEIKGLLQNKPKSSETPTRVNKKEGAKMLNVCSKTFDSYLKKGIIPYTQFKSKIYIKTSDIEKHLEKYYITKN